MPDADPFRITDLTFPSIRQIIREVLDVAEWLAVAVAITYLGMRGKSHLAMAVGSALITLPGLYVYVTLLPLLRPFDKKLRGRGGWVKAFAVWVLPLIVCVACTWTIAYLALALIDADIAVSRSGEL